MSLPAAILIGAACLIALLPPKWDPAIRIKERQIRNGAHPETPSCYRSKPGAQAQAENDCHTCGLRDDCLRP